jgi:hypothetical protein
LHKRSNIGVVGVDCKLPKNNKWWSSACAAGRAHGRQKWKQNLDATLIAHDFNGFCAQSTSQIAVKSQSKLMICQQVQEDDHVTLQWGLICMKCKSQQIIWDDHREMYKNQPGWFTDVHDRFAWSTSDNKSTGIATEGCTNHPGWFTDVQSAHKNQRRKAY